MKTLIAALVLECISVSSAVAGSCDVPSDRASDGSRCGGRAASERDGGN